jgi:NAD(P)-dependent dehydrogenase (short-subunit alcohol dehydrogenase family)
VDLQLAGKVALVTGKSKGIGRAVAEHLAYEHADVVITARTEEPLAVTARQIAVATGRTVMPMVGDMSVTRDRERCVNATLDLFGKIDILVTCAGSARRPAGGAHRRAVDVEPESQVHGLCPLGTRGHPAHAATRGEGHRSRCGERCLKPSYWEMTA